MVNVPDIFSEFGTWARETNTHNNVLILQLILHLVFHNHLILYFALLFVSDSGSVCLYLLLREPLFYRTIQ